MRAVSLHPGGQVPKLTFARSILLCTAVGALGVAGCGSDDDGDDITRRQAQELAVAQSPSKPARSAACVELEAARHFRCQIQLTDTTAGIYEVIVRTASSPSCSTAREPRVPRA